MSLAATAKVGPYEVISSLGAGGMGEVYRARDARLQRVVAIKVLPANFSDDRERLRRFEQEARAAAAVNHPNLLAIFDMGMLNGSPYIVTELLEGETLRTRLGAGPLPVRKVIEYALQIVRGLAAAHEKGIVHRDLKPDNIFVTRDDRVKILDFGLAKLIGTEAEQNRTTAPTIDTTPGVVLGTVGYMSPEQVRGGAADHRSDIFSFGAILYEMLSGKRAFKGDTSADTMSSILKDEPPDLIETNRNVPAALERIVRHCLEKNPDHRFHSAHDLAFDLENLTSLSGTALPARTVVAGHRRRTSVLVLVVVSLVAAAAALFLASRSGKPAPPPRFHRISYERGSVLNARFAPDGHSVIYEAAWEGRPPHLFSTPATGPEPRALDLEKSHLYAVSPSGEAALGLGGSVSNHFTVLSATLARSPLGGGAPREIASDVSAADWGPNGSLAIAHWAGGRMRLEFPIGKVLYETSGWISDLRIAPGGDKVAFLDHPWWPDDRGSVSIVDLAGNKKTLSGEWESEDGLAWAPDGHEIWFAATSAGIDRSLQAVTLSGKQRLVLTVPGSLRLYDIASDGRVLLSAGHERVGMIGITGDRRRDLSWSGWTIATDISPDGKTVLFDEQSEFAGHNYIVATRTLDGSPPVKLGDGAGGTFSPDGKWVTSFIPDQAQRYFLLPTGPGEPKEILVPGLDHLQGLGFAPDGRLLMTGSEPGHALRCYTQPRDGGPLTPVTPEDTRLCRFSPDSRYLIARDRTGGLSVYTPGGADGRPLPDTAGMAPIRWADNHSVLAVRLGEMPGHVFQIDVASGKQRLVKELVPGDLAGVWQVQIVAATPDVRALAYSYQQALNDLYVVEGLK